MIAHPRGPTVRAASRERGLRRAAAILLWLVPACYPNPDDLRSGGSAGTSGGVGGRIGSGGRAGGVGGNGGALGGQCGVAPCGGNIVGTWMVTFTCLGVVMGDATCPAQTLDASGVRQSGVITFNANETYSSSETDSGIFILDTPASCLSGVTCADFQTGFQGPGLVGLPNPTLSSASCNTTATGCRCLLGALGAPVTQVGTYTTSGTKLSTISSTNALNTNDYCASATILHVMDPTSTPASPNETVYAKQ